MTVGSFRCLEEQTGGRKIRGYIAGRWSFSRTLQQPNTSYEKLDSITILYPCFIFLRARKNKNA